MATARERRVEGGRTQSLFREVNERIEEMTSELRFVDGEIVCECANSECVETIPLTLDEYEGVRRIPTHFLIARGHDLPEIERVVDTNERYVVVEKFGEGGTVAVRLDPRGRSSA